jgi:phosphatidylserine/phosphatidylglycerophosphate/cardiolipin synthase-like enzyme
MANHELLSPGKFRGVRREGFDEIDRGTVTIPATWNEGLTLRNDLHALIDSAKETLLLTAWAFENDDVIFPALLNAMDRGVSVRILTKPTDRTTVALLPLVEKGATVYGHDRFHAKIAIVDNRTAVLMTANYTKKGLDEGFEAGILLKGKDTRKLSEIAALFEPICSWKLLANARIQDVNRQVRKYTSGSRDFVESEVLPEISVELLPAYQVELLTKIPDDLVTREKAEKTAKEKHPGKMIRKVSVRRNIIVPKVPPEAKQEDHKEIPFKVFRTKKNLYIAITRWEELDKATKLANEIKAKVVVGPS